MRVNCFLFLILAACLAAVPALASLSPSEVVVIYNSSTLADPVPYDWSISKTIADYYCAQRGIPSENEFGIKWPHIDHSIGPKDFVEKIQIPIQDQLQTQFGSDPGNPGSDKIKAIVLIYGVPDQIYGYDRFASVDSALSLLFSKCPWGKEPMGAWADSSSPIPNPYFSNSPLPEKRIAPADFGDFRASSFNDTSPTTPAWSVVRMLDATHAVAGGDNALLCYGVKSGGTWTWHPVRDTDKDFIAYRVNDISVADNQTALLCTSAGSILRTTNGGANWTTLRGSSVGMWVDNYVYMVDNLSAISFYGPGDGWVVGKHLYAANSYSAILEKWTSGSQSTNSGDLLTQSPTFMPSGVAATNDGHVWVSGTDTSTSGSLWVSTNSGGNWSRCYTDTGAGSSIKTVRVVKSGGQYFGWAIRNDNRILQTTDGTNWTLLDSPTAPGYNGDLAVYDAGHVAIGSNSNQILTFDSTNGWVSTTTDSSAASAVWSGDDLVCLPSDHSVRTGSGTPGSFTWATANFDIDGTTYPSIPDTHWKLRFLTGRLDGYPDRVDAGTGIPGDIKGMIDRSVTSSSGNSREALANAQFVLDDVADSSYPEIIPYLESLVGGSNVWHEGPTSYAINKQNVIGYSSNGSYDGYADNVTSLFRPFNNWKDGAVGVFWGVSYDGAPLRTPTYINAPQALAGSPMANTLTVTGMHTTSQYSGFYVGLYDANTGNRLARSFFSNGAATIDLSSISWPSNHQTYIQVHFPDNDPLHSNTTTGGDYVPDSDSRNYQISGWASTSIWDARTTGVTLNIGIRQSLISELIREGCSGTAGNVNEPYGTYVPHPNIILPQYANGNTWGESAYMGIQVLGWQEVIIGDPLMAPYEADPTVAFLDPSPSAGSKVAGHVLLPVSVTTDSAGPSGAIAMSQATKVDYQLTGSSGVPTLLGSDSVIPYYMVWDTTRQNGGTRVYPDGSYTMDVTGYQSGGAIGSTTLARSVTVDTTIPSITISTLTGKVRETTVISATTTGSPDSVEFWLYGETGDPYLITTDSTSPYECSIPTTFTDGYYSLQAVARYTTPSVAAYYSEPASVDFDNTTLTSIASIIKKTDDGSFCTLHDVVVTADTSCTSLGTGYNPSTPKVFYVQDPQGYSAIRAECSATTGSDSRLVVGRTVSVHGKVYKDAATHSGLRERYIEATAEGEFSDVEFGDIATTPPSPLGMGSTAVGGAAQTGTLGVLVGAGAYNTGLLSKVWGSVPYVGTDFYYVDDGGGLADGNVRGMTVQVPLDGTAVQHPYPQGVRVYCSNMTKPKPGDYVAVTGISSTFKIGGNIVPCIRMRSSSELQIVQADTSSTYGSDDFNTYASDYVEATTKPTWSASTWESSPRFKGVYVATDTAGNLVDVAPESKVWLKHAFAEQQTGTGSDAELRIRSWDSAINSKLPSPWANMIWPVFIRANTALAQTTDSAGRIITDQVTVFGTTYANSTDSTDQYIIPDRIYKKWQDGATPVESMMSIRSIGLTVASSVLSQGVAASSVAAVAGESEPGGGPIGPDTNYDDSGILQTDWFRQADSQTGAIGRALAMEDGAVVDLLGEHVVQELDGGITLAIKEWFEPGTPAPRLVLKLGTAVQGLAGESATIDILGATLTTLSDGRRALTNPTAVYLYIDEEGNMAPPVPPLKGSGSIMAWPWKRQIGL